MRHRKDNMTVKIAIDGPAGAGKSTIAKKVAKELGFIYVDTGAMYRAMALFFIHNNVKPEEKDRVESLCQQAKISICYQDGQQRVLLNGEDVTGSLRQEEVGNMASATSANPQVRAQLLSLQQDLAASENVVMDGRDIGTVVLPDAQVKIYLTASAKVRAARRCLELQQKGEAADEAVIEAQIIERDQRDMNREISPLRQAEDAVLLDSSDMNIEEVVRKILEIYRQKMA